MDTVSLFEALDQYEVQFVADFMSPFSRIIIRATCPYGKEMIAISKKMTFMNMIRKMASGTDHVRGRDLCELAREWGMHKKISEIGGTGFDVMMEYAAGCKNFVRARDLCELAKEWGATNFRGMLCYATIRGNRDLCNLAHEWSDGSNSTLNLSAMLTCAMERGHRDLCILATEWINDRRNDDYLNSMLVTAARSGNQDRCVLTKELMDAQGIEVKFDWILNAADYCENYRKSQAIKQLAREWMDERK